MRELEAVRNMHGGINVRLRSLKIRIYFDPMCIVIDTRRFEIDCSRFGVLPVAINIASAVIGSVSTNSKAIFPLRIETRFAGAFK